MTLRPQDKSVSAAAATTNANSAPVSARDTAPGKSRERGERAVVIGQSSDVPRALAHPAVSALKRLEVVGIVEVPSAEAETLDGEVEAVARLVHERDAGTVLVAGPVSRSLIHALADLALVHKCRLFAIPPTDGIPGQTQMVVWGIDSPLIRLARTPHHPWRLAAKRAVDLIGASIGLLVTLPLFLIVAVAIKAESRGPVLFRHRRVGRYGKTFDCFKLRTMTADAEAALQSNAQLREIYRVNHYKVPEHADPRITGVGRVLRQMSFDEVPQLINVLRGEMSLVGPRPVIEEELAHFGENVSLVLSVRPGLTGAWAVNGRHHVGYPKRAALELDYVRRWSLRMDARIILKTAAALRDPMAE